MAGVVVRMLDPCHKSATSPTLCREEIGVGGGRIYWRFAAQDAESQMLFVLRIKRRPDQQDTPPPEPDAFCAGWRRVPEVGRAAIARRPRRPRQHRQHE